MCYCVYVGVETPLALAEINVNRSVFYLEEVDTEEKAVEEHFSSSHVYYAGSREGCSCGLLCQQEEPVEDKAPAKTLLQFIAQILREEPAVELYTCWVGNQFKTPQERRQVYVSDFDVDADGFDLAEDVFLTFMQKA